MYCNYYLPSYEVNTISCQNDGGCFSSALAQGKTKILGLTLEVYLIWGFEFFVLLKKNN